MKSYYTLTDRFGNPINVGDRVKFRDEYSSEDDDIGVVIETPSYDTHKPEKVWVKWSQGQQQWVNESYRIEVIESVLTPSTFTDDDEKLLQSLIAKKKLASDAKEKVASELSSLCREIGISTGFVMNNSGQLEKLLHAYNVAFKRI